MSVLTPILPTAPPVLPRLHRFTVNEYHRMIQTGILTENNNVELLEGVIVPKMSRNPRHDACIQLSNPLLLRSLPAGWELRVQSALTLTDSEPEPDFTPVRGAPRSFTKQHPGPQDLGLVIEASDTSLRFDREEKGRIYAQARISCYWIINLQDAQIEVYSDPTGPDVQPTYRQRRDYGANESVPLVLDGQVVALIPVAEFLP